MTRRFDKLLVANRGEIAVRVIRGAQRLGYRTVAVYSEADSAAMHVRVADEAVCIGPPAAAESYLNINVIVEAARSSGAQAVHPGYGFLSERADFAAAVQKAGLVFIGPNPESIEAMGNKSAAKARMLAAKVPCIPGYQGDDQSDETLSAESLKAGLPVMIKAAAGGGGRGMRLVSEKSELKANIQSARSEATNAFGSGQLLVEKAVVGGRHIEIQIFGDSHGNAVHLGERDCSIQRRNQKVVEEAPSPVVDETLRRKMGEAAVAAAKAVKYVGAGTVEFMLDADCEHFYFLEMNTRLQVEHAITEAVYGVDLVEWQLAVAQGEELPLSQEDILARRHGHAIEVRLCTEDPAENYLPQSGPVLRWAAPQGEGVRVDTWLVSGTEVTPYYDSMQAKIVVFGESRAIARARMAHALEGTELLGVRSNRDFAHAIIGNADYAAGQFDTGFIPKHFPQSALDEAPATRHGLLAALVLMVDASQALAETAHVVNELLGWCSVGAAATQLRLEWRDATLNICASTRDGRHFQLADGDTTLVVDVTHAAPGTLRYRCEGREERLRYARQGHSCLWLDADGRIEPYTDKTYAPAAAASGGASDGRVLARSDGRIAAVHVAAGDAVQQGQALVVLEAMKMEFQVPAPVAGTVAAVEVATGTQVKARQLLVQIDPDAAE